VKEDYATFVPAVDKAIAADEKIRMLVVMHDFHGWTASAAFPRPRLTCEGWRNQMAAWDGGILQTVHDRDRALLRARQGRRSARLAEGRLRTAILGVFTED